MTKTIRYYTKKMAQQMAWDIQAYWLNQGHMIHVWVERTTDKNARDYMVRSNLHNGLPVKK